MIHSLGLEIYLILGFGKKNWKETLLVKENESEITLLTNIYLNDKLKINNIQHFL